MFLFGLLGSYHNLKHKYSKCVDKITVADLSHRLTSFSHSNFILGMMFLPDTSLYILHCYFMSLLNELLAPNQFSG